MSGNNKILERYTGRTNEGQTESPVDGEVLEDFSAFGVVRGLRDRAVMLELRKRTGDIVAIGYSWIGRMQYNTSEITLHIGDDKIFIKGRNLNVEVRPDLKLFQSLTRHRVGYIRETDRAASLQADSNAVVVDSIEW